MSEDEIERGDSEDYSDGGDSWDEEEDLRDYRKGGYHPVKINDKFSQARAAALLHISHTGHHPTLLLITLDDVTSSLL